MKNKILSMLLVFSMIFSNNLALAMENPPIPMENSRSQSPTLGIPVTNNKLIQSKHYQRVFYLLGALCLSLITGTSGYLFGYKKGNKNKLEPFKEITLYGEVFLQSGDIQYGDIEPILLARLYKKDVIKNDIPNLNQIGKFPAHKLSAIEHYLDLSDNISKNETLNSEIKALVRTISGKSCDRSRKIKLGSLKDLVQEAADLIERAYDEVYVKKNEL